MVRLFVITFGFLGWAWFELSGGDEFEAGTNGIRALAQVEQKSIDVTRVDSGGALTSVADAGGPKLSFAAALTPKPETLLPAAASEKVAALSEPAPAVVQTAAVDNSLLSGVMAVKLDANGAPVEKAVVTEETRSGVDYRLVTGNSVNMRNGPGTNFSVVGRLQRGNEVEILQDEGRWVKLRALDGNQVGWMSSKFLKPAG